jgi:hypothetical protein
MTRDELNRLWNDPKNWGIVYRCAEDPRVIVRKRNPLVGWTINFAHPLAGFAVLLSVAIAIGPFLLLMLFGIFSALLAMVTLFASIGLLIALSHWEESRSRE